MGAYALTGLFHRWIFRGPHFRVLTFNGHDSRVQDCLIGDGSSVITDLEYKERPTKIPEHAEDDINKPLGAVAVLSHMVPLVLVMAFAQPPQMFAMAVVLEKTRPY